MHVMRGRYGSRTVRFCSNQTKRKHLKLLLGIRKALLTAAWDVYMSFAKRHGFAQT